MVHTTKDIVVNDNFETIGNFLNDRFESIDKFLCMFVKIDVLYSAIEHARDNKVGTFCGSNNQSITTVFYTVIFLFGVLSLLFSTMKIWYEDIKKRTKSEDLEELWKGKIKIRVENIVFYPVFIFITFSFLFYMLKDNNQPLICHFKHNDTDLEPAGREKYTIVKIVISLCALITSFFALAIGYLCSKKTTDEKN